MIPTDALRTRLRELVDDSASSPSPIFSPSEIDELLTDNTTIYGAAADGWRQKAGKMPRILGTLKSYEIGSESYTMVDLDQAIEACLKMAAQYDGMAKRRKAGALMVSVARPSVLE